MFGTFQRTFAPFKTQAGNEAMVVGNAPPHP